jgi:hypothetical protein
MALNTVLTIDAYRFNSVGNAFVRKETISIPLPAQFVPCAPGPDGQMRAYSKILYGTNFQQEAYVGQTVSQLNTLANA